MALPSRINIDRSSCGWQGLGLVLMHGRIGGRCCKVGSAEVESSFERSTWAGVELR